MTPAATITTTATHTSTTTVTPEPATTYRQEENKAKTFLKKTFFNPFKKLDNFIQDFSLHSKESHTHPRPPSLSPVIRSSAENSPSKSAADTSHHGGSRDSSPDLPPVVVLDSPDLAVRVFTGGQKGSGTPADIQSPDSAHSALSVFGEEVGNKPGGGASPTSEAASGASALRVEVMAPESGDAAAGRTHLTF